MYYCHFWHFACVKHFCFVIFPLNELICCSWACSLLIALNLYSWLQNMAVFTEISEVKLSEIPIYKCKLGQFSTWNRAFKDSNFKRNGVYWSLNSLFIYYKWSEDKNVRCVLWWNSRAGATLFTVVYFKVAFKLPHNCSCLPLSSMKKEHRSCLHSPIKERARLFCSLRSHCFWRLKLFSLQCISRHQLHLYAANIEFGL